MYAFQSQYLISHDHQMPISERLHTVILLPMLQSKNLFYILNLRILHYLFMACLSHIQEFSSQWKHSIIVPSHNRYSCHLKN